LDEVFIRIQGVQHYPWRAVDQDGVVVDILVPERRDRKAAQAFLQAPAEGLFLSLVGAARASGVGRGQADDRP
jgi:hypothetical protein